MDWIEGLGYLASVLVAISLMMSSIVKLRWINLVGALFFSSYGFIIGALPVAFVNLFIVFANIYYLRQIYGQEDQFQLVEAETDSPLVAYWLKHYQADIAQFFPKFEQRDLSRVTTLVMMKNHDVVGIFIGKQQGDSLEVYLDYVFEQYRDFKTAEYLFKHSQYFQKLGVTQILVNNCVPTHQQYLTKVGFNTVDGQTQQFILKL